MHDEFSATIERDGEWFVAYCPEDPGANGQGKTEPQCLDSLADAVQLVLDDRRRDAFRRLPDSAMVRTVTPG